MNFLDYGVLDYGVLVEQVILCGSFPSFVVAQ